MKLILINGPTGVGKSTLTAHLHQQMPSSVLLDIDEMRRAIPDYREKREESLHLAYEHAANAIEDALLAHKDVIVDKTIADPQVLDKFIAVAEKHGAAVHEFLLLADKESVQKRADERGYRAGGLLTPEKVGEHWERADRLRSERPSAIVVDTTNLTPEEVLKTVSARIGGD